MWPMYDALSSRTPNQPRRTSAAWTCLRSRLVQAMVAVVIALTSWGVAMPAAQAAPSVATASSTGLARGAEGAAVKDLQTRLAARGVFVPGGADGVFGAATERAVRQFQNWNGLSVTGAVNTATARALGLSSSGGSSSAAAAPAASSGYAGLKVGSRGSKVKEVQSALIGAGVAVRGGADGVFGNVTKAALTKYQKGVGVSATGVVDDATAKKLGLGSSSKPVAFSSGSSSSASTSTPATSASSGYVGLKIGSRGTKVAELQRAIQNTGITVRGGADGVFGPATASALRSFQKVNGISQTGVTTAGGVRILALGTGAAQGVSGGSSVKLDTFPVAGHCYFGDTWHASRGGGRVHEGVDIIASSGTKLVAVVDGTISKQYWDQPGARAGNGVRVQQANGTYFTYLHMLDFAPGIKVGAKVKAGDVIGWVGNTGSSATPHLHFEIHPGGGSPINPYSIVKAMGGC